MGRLLPRLRRLLPSRPLEHLIVLKSLFYIRYDDSFMTT